MDEKELELYLQGLHDDAKQENYLKKTFDKGLEQQQEKTDYDYYINNWKNDLKRLNQFGATDYDWEKSDEATRLGTVYEPGSQFNDENLWRKQGIGEQLYNASNRFLWNTIGDTVGGFASMIDLPGYIDPNKGVFRDFAETMRLQKEAVNKAKPIYQKEGAGMTGPGMAAWWIENGSSLASSASSFMLQGAGIGKAMQGIKWLSSINKINKYDDLARRGKDLVTGETLTGVGKTGEQIAAGLERADMARNLASSVALTQSAAMMSATETYANVYQEALDSGYGEEYAKAVAGSAASNVVNLSRANILLNMTSANKFLGGSKNIKSLKPESFLPSWKNKTLGTALKEGGQEALEENIELSAQKQAETLASDALSKGTEGVDIKGDYIPGLGLIQAPLLTGNVYGDATWKDITETTLLGAIGGVAQTGLTDLKNRIGSETSFGGLTSRFGTQVEAKHATNEYYSDGSIKAYQGDTQYETEDNTIKDKDGKEVPDYVYEPDGSIAEVDGKKEVRQKIKTDASGQPIAKLESKKYSQKELDEKLYEEQVGRFTKFREAASKNAGTIATAKYQAQLDKTIGDLNDYVDMGKTGFDVDKKAQLIDDLARINLVNQGTIDLDANPQLLIDEKAKVAADLENMSAKEIRQKQDELLNFSLSRTAIESFENGTKEPLIEMLKEMRDVSPEKAKELGYDENYKQKAQEAIDQVNKDFDRWMEFNTKRPGNIARALFKNRKQHDYLSQTVDRLNKEAQVEHETAMKQHAANNDVDLNKVDDKGDDIRTVKSRYDEAFKIEQEKIKKIHSDKKLKDIEDEVTRLEKEIALLKVTSEDLLKTDPIKYHKDLKTKSDEIDKNLKEASDRRDEISESYDEKIKGLVGSFHIGKASEIYLAKLKAVEEARQLDKIFDELTSKEGQQRLAKLERENAMKAAKTMRLNATVRELMEFQDPKNGGKLYWDNDDLSGEIIILTGSNTPAFKVDPIDEFLVSENSTVKDENGEVMSALEYYDSQIDPRQEDAWKQQQKDNRKDSKQQVADTTKEIADLKKELKEAQDNLDKVSAAHISLSNVEGASYDAELDALTDPDAIRKRLERLSKVARLLNPDPNFFPSYLLKEHIAPGERTLFRALAVKMNELDKEIKSLESKIIKSTKALETSKELGLNKTVPAKFRLYKTDVKDGMITVSQMTPGDIIVPLTFDNVMEKMSKREKAGAEIRQARKEYTQVYIKKMRRIKEIYDGTIKGFNDANKQRQDAIKNYNDFVNDYNDLMNILHLANADKSGRNTIDHTNPIVNKFNKIVAGFNSGVDKIFTDEETSLRKNIEDYQNKIIKNTKEIKKLDNDMADVQAKILNINSSKNISANQKKLLDKLNNNLKGYQTRKKYLEDDIPKRTSDISKWENYLKVIDNHSRDIDLIHKELNDLIVSKKTIEADIAKLNTIIDGFNDQLSHVTERISYNKKLQQDIIRAIMTREKYPAFRARYERLLEDVELLQSSIYDELIGLNVTSDADINTINELIFSKGSIDLAKVRTFINKLGLDNSSDIYVLFNQLNSSNTELDNMITDNISTLSDAELYAKLDELRAIISTDIENQTLLEELLGDSNKRYSEMMNKAEELSTIGTDTIWILSRLDTKLQAISNKSKEIWQARIEDVKTDLQRYANKMIEMKDISAESEKLAESLYDDLDILEKYADVFQNHRAEFVNQSDLSDGRSDLIDMINHISDTPKEGNKVNMLSSLEAQLALLNAQMKANDIEVEQLSNLIKLRAELYAIVEANDLSVTPESYRERYRIISELEKGLFLDSKIVTDEEIESRLDAAKAKVEGSTINERRTTIENELPILKLIFNKSAAEEAAALDKVEEQGITDTKITTNEVETGLSIDIDTADSNVDPIKVNQDSDIWQASKPSIFTSIPRHINFLSETTKTRQRDSDGLPVMTKNPDDLAFMNFLNSFTTKPGDLTKGYKLELTQVSDEEVGNLLIPQIDKSSKNFTSSLPAKEIDALEGNNQGIYAVITDDKGNRIYINAAGESTTDKDKAGFKLAYMMIPNPDSKKWDTYIGDNMRVNQLKYILGKADTSFQKSFADFTENKESVVTIGGIKYSTTENQVVDTKSLSELKAELDRQIQADMRHFRLGVVNNTKSGVKTFVAINGLSSGSLLDKVGKDGNIELRNATDLFDDGFVEIHRTEASKGSKSTKVINGLSYNLTPGVAYVEQKDGSVIPIYPESNNSNDIDLILRLISTVAPSPGNWVTEGIFQVFGTKNTVSSNLVSKGKETTNIGLLNKLINWTGIRKDKDGKIALKPFDIAISGGDIMFADKDGKTHYFAVEYLIQYLNNGNDVSKLTLGKNKGLKYAQAGIPQLIKFLGEKRKHIHFELTKSVKNKKGDISGNIMEDYYHPVLVTIDGVKQVQLKKFDSYKDYLKTITKTSTLNKDDLGKLGLSSNMVGKYLSFGTEQNSKPITSESIQIGNIHLGEGMILKDKSGKEGVVIKDGDKLSINNVELNNSNIGDYTFGSTKVIKPEVKLDDTIPVSNEESKPTPIVNTKTYALVDGDVIKYGLGLGDSTQSYSSTVTAVKYGDGLYTMYLAYGPNPNETIGGTVQYAEFWKIKSDGSKELITDKFKKDWVSGDNRNQLEQESIDIMNLLGYKGGKLYNISELPARKQGQQRSELIGRNVETVSDYMEAGSKIYQQLDDNVTANSILSGNLILNKYLPYLMSGNPDFAKNIDVQVDKDGKVFILPIGLTKEDVNEVELTYINKQPTNLSEIVKGNNVFAKLIKTLAGEDIDKLNIPIVYTPHLDRMGAYIRGAKRIELSLGSIIENSKDSSDKVRMSLLAHEFIHSLDSKVDKTNSPSWNKMMEIRNALIDNLDNDILGREVKGPDGKPYSMVAYWLFGELVDSAKVQNAIKGLKLINKGKAITANQLATELKLESDSDSEFFSNVLDRTELQEFLNSVPFANLGLSWKPSKKNPSLWDAFKELLGELLESFGLSGKVVENSVLESILTIGAEHYRANGKFSDRLEFVGKDDKDEVSTDVIAVKGRIAGQGTSIELEITGKSGKEFLLVIDRNGKGNIDLYSEKKEFPDGVRFTQGEGRNASKEQIEKLYDEYIPKKTQDAITNWLNSFTGSWAAPETQDGENYKRVEKELEDELSSLDNKTKVDIKESIVVGVDYVAPVEVIEPVSTDNKIDNRTAKVNRHRPKDERNIKIGSIQKKMYGSSDAGSIIDLAGLVGNLSDSELDRYMNMSSEDIIEDLNKSQSSPSSFDNINDNIDSNKVNKLLQDSNYLEALSEVLSSDDYLNFIDNMDADEDFKALVKNASTISEINNARNQYIINLNEDVELDKGYHVEPLTKLSNYVNNSIISNRDNMSEKGKELSSSYDFLGEKLSQVELDSAMSGMTHYIFNYFMEEDADLFFSGGFSADETANVYNTVRRQMTDQVRNIMMVVERAEDGEDVFDIYNSNNTRGIRIGLNLIKQAQSLAIAAENGINVTDKLAAVWNQIDNINKMYNEFLGESDEAKNRYKELVRLHSQKMKASGFKFSGDVIDEMKIGDETVIGREAHFSIDTGLIDQKTTMPGSTKLMVAALSNQVKNHDLSNNTREVYESKSSYLGFPEPNDFNETYNLLVKILANLPGDRSIMMEELTKAFNAENQTNPNGVVLRGLVGKDAPLSKLIVDGEPNLGITFNQFRLINQFIQSFAKFQPNAIISRIDGNGITHHINANVDRASEIVKRKWAESFKYTLTETDSDTLGLSMEVAGQFEKTVSAAKTLWESQLLTPGKEGMKNDGFVMLGKALSSIGMEIADIAKMNSFIEGRSLSSSAKDNIFNMILAKDSLAKSLTNASAESNYEYNPYTDRNIEGTIKTIAEAVAASSNQVSDNQYMWNGQTQYASQLNSNLSIIANMINYHSEQGTLRTELPHLFNVYNQNSVLRKMVEDDGVKIIIGELKGLTGLDEDDVDQKELDAPDKWANTISATMHGHYGFFRAADRGKENSFQFQNRKGVPIKLYDHNQSVALDAFYGYLIDEVNAMVAHRNGLGKNIKFYDKFGGDFRFFSDDKISSETKELIMGEINKGLPASDIKDTLDIIKSDIIGEIRSYFAREAAKVKEELRVNKVLVHRPIDKLTKDDYSSGKKVTELHSDAKYLYYVGIGLPGNIMSNYMKGLDPTYDEMNIATKIKELERQLSYSTDVTKSKALEDSVSKLKVEQAKLDARYEAVLDELLLDFNLFQYGAYIEQTKMFTGDPAMYKNSDDFFKRMSMLNSTKKISIIDEASDKILNHNNRLILKTKEGVIVNYTLSPKDTINIINNKYQLIKLPTETVNAIKKAVSDQKLKMTHITDLELDASWGFNPDYIKSGKQYDGYFQSMIGEDVPAVSTLAADRVKKIDVIDGKIVYFDKDGIELSAKDNNFNTDTNTPPAVSKLRRMFAESFFKDGITNPSKLNNKVQSYLDPYLKMDESDAQAWVTLPMYKEILLRSDSWTAKHEKAYVKMLMGKPVSDKEMSYFRVLKTQYAGPMGLDSSSDMEQGETVTENKEGNNLFIPTGYKHSLFPLIPSVIEGTNLGLLNKVLSDNGVGIYQKTSANKFGRVLVDGKSNDPYSKTGSFQLGANPVIQNTSFRYFGIQLEQAPKMKYDITAGTQWRKLALSNLIEFGVPVDFVSEKGAIDNEVRIREWNDLTQGEKLAKSNLYKLYNEYQEVQKELFARPFRQLVKELKVRYITENGKIVGYQMDNRQKLVDILLDSDSDLSDNVKISIEELLNADTFIEQIANKDKAEAVMFAIINSRVLKEKRKGEGSPQVAVSFFEKTGENRRVTEPDKKGNVKYYSNDSLRHYEVGKNGKTLPAHCMVGLPVELSEWVENVHGGLDGFNSYLDALHAKLDGIEKDGKEDTLTQEDRNIIKLITLIGFRIPNQGLQSAEFMRVRRFLPSVVGDSIVVPTEMVGKAGSDFDIDKLNVYYSNYIKPKQLKPKDGQTEGEWVGPKYVEYLTTSNSKVEDRKKVVNGNGKKGSKKTNEKFAELPINQQNSKEALQNRMIELQAEIMSDLYNYRQLMSPISDDVTKSQAWNIRMLNTPEGIDRLQSKRVVNKDGEWVATDEPGLQQVREDSLKSILAKNGSPAILSATFADKDGNITFIKGSELVVDKDGNVTYNKEEVNLQQINLKPDVQLEWLLMLAPIYSDYQARWKEDRDDEMKNKVLADIARPLININKFIEFLSGKAGVGQTAVHITHHQLAMAANLSLNTDRSYWVFPHTLVDGKPSFANKLDKDGEWISETLSAFVNSYVDIAKDPYVKDMNAGNKTANMMLMLVRAGASVSWIIKFISQPIIKDYIQAQRGNESMFNKIAGIEKKKYQVVSDVMSNYGKNVGFDTKMIYSSMEEADNKLEDLFKEYNLITDESAKSVIKASVPGIYKEAENAVRQEWEMIKNLMDNQMFTEEKLGEYILFDAANKLAKDKLTEMDPNHEFLKPEVFKENLNLILATTTGITQSTFLANNPGVYNNVQAAILDLFLEYQRQSKDFQMMIRVTSADTKQAQQDLEKNKQFFKDVEQVKFKNRFNNLDKIWNESVVSEAHSVLEQSVKMVKPLYYFENNNTIRRSVDKLITDITDAKSMSADEKAKLAKTVNQDLLTAIVTSDLIDSKYNPRTVFEELFIEHPSNTYIDSTGNKAPLTRIIFELNSDKIKLETVESNWIKQGKDPNTRPSILDLAQLKNFPGNVKNQVIQALTGTKSKDSFKSYDEFTNKLEIDKNAPRFNNVIVKNRINPDMENVLRNAFIRIKEVSPKVYEDLIRMSVNQSGIHQVSDITFGKMIPAEHIQKLTSDKLAAFNRLSQKDQNILLNQFTEQFKERSLSFIANVKTTKKINGEYWVNGTDGRARLPYLIHTTKDEKTGKFMTRLLKGNEVTRDDGSSRVYFSSEDQYGYHKVLKSPFNLGKLRGHGRFFLGYDLSLNDKNSGVSKQSGIIFNDNQGEINMMMNEVNINTIPNDNFTKGKLGIGESIASTSDNLAFALTNPTVTSPTGYDWKRSWTPGQSQWRNYMSKGIDFNGVNYKDVEQAYQKNKDKYPIGPDRDSFMLKLIETKLRTYPKLIEGIDSKGGLKYILDSTHQPTNKNSHWETGGNNMFIKLLAQAYQNVNKNEVNEINSSKQFYTGDIKPEKDVIFVFGSNPEGRHGAGAAKVAQDKFGAIYGQGEGLQGNSYALPTKDLRVKENSGFKSISPTQITENIKKLYQVAQANPDKQFKIGYRNTTDKSLNGYTGLEMIEMFNNAGTIPSNIIFSKEWFDTGKLNINKPTINQPVSQVDKSELTEEEFLDLKGTGEQRSAYTRKILGGLGLTTLELPTSFKYIPDNPMFKRLPIIGQSKFEIAVGGFSENGRLDSRKIGGLEKFFNEINDSEGLKLIEEVKKLNDIWNPINTRLFAQKGDHVKFVDSKNKINTLISNKLNEYFVQIGMDKINPTLAPLFIGDTSKSDTQSTQSTVDTSYNSAVKEADTRKPIAQNFFDGYRPNSDATKVHTIKPEITAKYGKGVKTITLVKDGIRTRSTRLANWMKDNNPKVGDYFWQINEKNPDDKVLTRITAVYGKSDPRYKSNWYKEGWIDANFKFVENYDSAIEFEVVSKDSEFQVNNPQLSLMSIDQSKMDNKAKKDAEEALNKAKKDQCNL